MFIALLGRQPEISIAELSAMYGEAAVQQIAHQWAAIEAPSVAIDSLGGTLKVAEIVETLSLKHTDRASLLAASDFITKRYFEKYQNYTGKITLGLSAYGLSVSPRDIQKTGLILKAKLKKTEASLRLIPNNEPALSTATSHNNGLGRTDNKLELIIIKTSTHQLLIAESRGTQNITAYTRRDQARPKRDAFVGMLPPKLAQIMINLALSDSSLRSDQHRNSSSPDEASSEGDDENTAQPTRTILDPFCGTGVLLQEAALQGYSVYGSDLSEKMIRYSRDNLNWLKDSHRIHFDWYLEMGDAMTHTWRQPIDAVVCETYLGQPFSAPPSPPKLKEVVGNCNHIIGTFLKNIHPQLNPGTPLCIAVPAWRSKEGQLTHLPLLAKLESLGYQQLRSPLVYAREDQVVARELIVLKTI